MHFLHERVTALCCIAVLQHYLEVKISQSVHREIVALQTRSPPQPCTNCRGVVTLWPLSQPVFAASDGPGQTSIQSSSLGHLVWLNCPFVFPVIQAPPSQVSACLWSLPGPQAPAVPLSGQVMSPPSTLTRGRFNRAHCQKCARSWVVNKCIPHYLAISQTSPVLVADCLTTVLSFNSSPGNSLKLWRLLLF